MGRKRINIRTVVTKIGLLSILVTFTQCATSQKIDKMAPVELNAPYFQNWVSGIEGGGAGFMLYIPVDPASDVQLENAYFKGKSVKLKRKPNEAVYVGRYTDPGTVRKDIVMSDDPKEEYNNKAPEIEEKIPFELKEGECVIAYSKNGKEGYFKLDNLPEKELKAYPMQPRQ
ncbi:hypothetical protein [uncultured Aquimarina sp.]|uniref:hypothetical protein n=1 Tax=uncultured Aquimarina sp. TaxID=575652 RepID=UPI0026372B6A|nr:hypothetical protein [uncultured Aquimarina sp.]